LPEQTVHVWSTSIRSPRRTAWFRQRAEVHPRAGTFGYTLDPGRIYTFTTVSDPVHTRAGPPASASMPLPYTSSPDASGEPTDLAPQDGAFEYPTGDTTTFEQTAVGRPVFWQSTSAARFPYAVLGDGTHSDYTVSASVTFTAAGQSAGLIARFSHPKTDGGGLGFNGYLFVVNESGNWSLVRYTVGGTLLHLVSGSTGTALGVNTAIPVSLSVHGSTLTGSVNGTQVVQVSDPTGWQTGIAGISTGGWYRVTFGNLQLTS
jgi:hypothetical protein